MRGSHARRLAACNAVAFVEGLCPGNVIKNLGFHVTPTLIHLVKSGCRETPLASLDGSDMETDRLGKNGDQHRPFGHQNQ